jgi:hypothetical protein
MQEAEPKRKSTQEAAQAKKAKAATKKLQGHNADPEKKTSKDPKEKDPKAKDKGES